MTSQKFEKITGKQGVKAVKEGSERGEEMNGEKIWHVRRFWSQPTRDAGKTQENILETVSLKKCAESEVGSSIWPTKAT